MPRIAHMAWGGLGWAAVTPWLPGMEAWQWGLAGVLVGLSITFGDRGGSQASS